MNYKEVYKDAFWQVVGRIFSAVGGFITVRMMTPYLWPLRYGDYNTILKYFAIWSALADLGLYVIALKEIGKIKNQLADDGLLDTAEWKKKLSDYYSKFMWSRLINLLIVYGIAIIIAYLIPSYNQNIFIEFWLPLGMLFSSIFVIWYFFQLPLQLFGKMQHTTYSLIFSRAVQIAIMWGVLLLWPGVDFSQADSWTARVFCAVLLSVVWSGLAQIVWQYIAWKKYISLHLDLDRSFFINHIKNNRKFGVGYFMSSFHTLAVSMLLSWFFPTKDGFVYVWVRGLAMTLVEILLIVPPSIWNSILHKVSHSDLPSKLKALGTLLMSCMMIWAVIAINFRVFGKEIIYLVSGTKYLTDTLSSTWSLWSDYILWFLGVVLVLTFLKQSLNYVLIATDQQNKLFKINTFGVLLWLALWVWVVYHYNLLGGIIAQVWIELLFFLWWLFYCWKKDILPRVDIMFTIKVVVVSIILAMIWRYADAHFFHANLGLWSSLLKIWLYNIIIFGVFYLLWWKYISKLRS